MFTLWNKIKHKKFKVTTVLDVLFATIIILLLLLAREVRADDSIKWESPFSWSLGSGCTDPDVDFHFNKALDEIAYVDTIRQSDKPYAGSSLDGVSLLFCSDKQPPAALSNDPRSGSAAFKDSAGATVGYAWWWWNNDLVLVECDVWIKIGVTTMKSLTKHEAGHCMGLFEHSPDINDVMHSSAATSSWSNEDMLRMATLYEGCPRTGRTTEDYNALFATKWMGFTLYGFLDAGGVWPDDIYDYATC